MKKSTIAIGFTVLGIGMLAGCQEATTGGVSPSSNSTLNGVTSLHAGIATALTADSTPLDSAVIDSSGAFRIVFPSDAVPVFVRCDSAGIKLLGLVPHGMRDSIVVDSATHLAVDSLRKNKFDVSAIDSTTWMRWRTVFEARRKADSARIDSIAQHHRVDTSNIDTFAWHHKVDTSRIDTSAWHHKVDTSNIDTTAWHHKVDTSRIDTSAWHHRVDTSRIDTSAWHRRVDTSRIDTSAWHRRVDTSRIDTTAWHHRVDTSRIDSSAWHRKVDTSRIDTTNIDTSAWHHRIDTTNIDTATWHHRIDSLSSRSQKLDLMVAASKSLAMSTDSPFAVLTLFGTEKDKTLGTLKESDHLQDV